MRQGWPRACRSWNACCAPWRQPRREGGDVRGRQSAAIMVVDAELHPRAWRGRGLVMDMRIEDHPDPVPELRRIVTLQLAYDMLDDEGDEAKAGQECRGALRRVATLGAGGVRARVLAGAGAGDRRRRGRSAAGRWRSRCGRTTPGAARSSTWRRRAGRASRPSWRRSCWATERAAETATETATERLTRPMRTTARIGVSARLGTRHVSQATRQQPHGCPAAPLYATRAYGAVAAPERVSARPATSWWR